MKEFDWKLQNEIDTYQDLIKSFSVGRASPAMIAGIKVFTSTGILPLKALANIDVVDNKSLEIKIWDKSHTHEIEAALKKCDIIGSIIVQKDKILCTFPDVTLEERQKLSRKISELKEETKIRMRIIRQKEMDFTKSQKLSENNEKSQLKNLQTIFDKKNDILQEIFEKKNKEILHK